MQFFLGNKVTMQQMEMRKDTGLQQESAEGSSTEVAVRAGFSKPHKQQKQQSSTLHTNKWMH